MVDLSKYIYELLHFHECVVIPGLGGFIIRKKNAVVYMAQNLFAPPSKYLHFNSQLTHNDGLLAHHISKETGTGYEKALEDIDEAVSDILYQLYRGKNIVFNDIGTISNLNGFLKFEPSSEQNIQDENYGLNSFIMPILQPERHRNRQIVNHKESKKTQRKLIKSYQIAAVVAFLLFGIGSYFLQTEPVQDYMKSSFFPQISLIAEDFLTDRYTEQTIDNKLIIENEERIDIASVEKETVFPTPEEAPFEIESTPVLADVSENSFIQTPDLGQYYIIIGAFKQHELAENLCARMKENGYNMVAILDIPSSSLHRVALQSFDNLASAQEALRGVKQMQEDAWVLKWKN